MICSYNLHLSSKIAWLPSLNTNIQGMKRMEGLLNCSPTFHRINGLLHCTRKSNIYPNASCSENLCVGEHEVPTL